MVFHSAFVLQRTLRKSDYDEPDDVWNQLYSGSFFPRREDQVVFQRFHNASPVEKLELVSDISDAHAQKPARWLIGSEWPEVMAPQERKSIDEEFREHLTQEEAKWTTIPSAMEKIKEL